LSQLNLVGAVNQFHTVAHNCHGKINFATAKSFSPRQNQFRHGKIIFATAKSFSPRQNQFRHGKKSFSPRQNQFRHGKIIFIYGKIIFNLVPRVLSLPTSRKYPGCGWSRVYVYKSNPHRGWVFDLIVSKLSVEEKVALPHRRYFES